jgi:DNA-binding transcriptional ArsR family regulator
VLVSEPIKEIVNIDRVVHEPARLAILVALDVCVSADFKYLQALTGLSASNLSVHLTKLEEHGLIEIEKTFVRKKGRTTCRLAKQGKEALRAYRRLIEEPKRSNRKWAFLLRQALSLEPAG